MAAGPLPDGAPDDLLELVGVAEALAQRVLDGGHDAGPDLVEDGVVLGEASGVDLGRDDDLARVDVDDHEHGDEALGAEDAPVLEGGLGNVSDRRAVDVHESAVHGPDDLGDAVEEIDDDPVLARITRSAATPVRMASSAFARRWRYSPWTGMTLPGRTML